MGFNRTLVPHEELLTCAGLTSIETVILTRQLKWLGHVRMPGTRFSKKELFGELVEDQRPCGGPMKQYRDHIKKILLSCAIDPSQPEDLTSDQKRLEKCHPYWHESLRCRVEPNARNEEATVKSTADTKAGGSLYLAHLSTGSRSASSALRGHHRRTLTDYFKQVSIFADRSKKQNFKQSLKHCTKFISVNLRAEAAH